MLNLMKKKRNKLLSTLNQKNVANLGHNAIAKDIVINEKSMQIEKLCRYALIITGVGILLYNLDDIYAGELLKFQAYSLQGIISEISDKTKEMLSIIHQILLNRDGTQDLVIKIAEVIAPLFIAYRVNKAYKKDKFENRVLKGDYINKQGIIRKLIWSYSKKSVNKKIDKLNSSLITKIETTAKNIENPQIYNSDKSTKESESTKLNDNKAQNQNLNNNEFNNENMNANLEVLFDIANSNNITNIDDIEQSK